MAQICGGDRGPATVFGLSIDITGDLAGVQKTAASWNSGDCAAAGKDQEKRNVKIFDIVSAPLITTDRGNNTGSASFTNSKFHFHHAHSTGEQIIPARHQVHSTSSQPASISGSKMATVVLYSRPNAVYEVRTLSSTTRSLSLRDPSGRRLRLLLRRRSVPGGQTRPPTGER